MTKPLTLNPSAISRRLRAADILGARVTTSNRRGAVWVTSFSASSSPTALAVDRINRAATFLHNAGYAVDRISADMLTVTLPETKEA